MSNLLQDLRHALRMMARSPGFTAATLTLLVLTLAANNAIFGLVNSILLNPLPEVHEPQRLFGISNNAISHPTYLDFKEDLKGTADLADFTNRSMRVDISGQSAPRSGQLVSGNYFSVVGTGCALGRLLGPADDRPDAPAVAVVSHAFWVKTLHEDPGAVGSILSINGTAVEIVGVSAPGFRGTQLFGSPEFFAPLSLWPRIVPSTSKGPDLGSRNWLWLSVVGRMAPGVELAQVEADINRSLRRQIELHPHEARLGELKLRSAVQMAAGTPRTREILTRFFAILAGVVGGVLILGCANLANLLLARGRARRREIAVRLSMGASAGRLVRQLLTESLLLAFIAGALSLLAVQFINEILTRFTLPSGMSLRALDLMPGRPLVLFASLASLVTGLLFGLAPALQSVRVDLMDDLRGAGSGSKPARRRGGPLLVTQVGLSVVLLAGAGLFTRSLQRALSLDPGFRTNHVATLEPDLELAGYTAERVVGFHDEASRRLATLPGVRAVTWTSALPLMDAIIQQSIVVPGYAQAPGEMPMATFQVVGPGYAKLLGIPILRGREFAPQDQEGSESVAIVNESLARRYFGGRNPLGGRIDVYGRTRRVVGIMKDVQMHNLTDAPSPTILIPYGQTSDYWTLVGMKALVQTSGDPAHLAGALRAQLAWLDPGVPLQSVGTLQDRLMALLAPQRMAASLMGWLSALALIIVAVGVYGAAAYEVTRRTREIGIRVALGATSSSLLRLVLGRNLGFLALGIILGAPLAVALGSVASSFLYGIAATDSITYAATALVLLSAGGLASYLPARRAARVDPMVALRCE